MIITKLIFFLVFIISNVANAKAKQILKMNITSEEKVSSFSVLKKNKEAILIYENSGNKELVKVNIKDYNFIIKKAKKIIAKKTKIVCQTGEIKLFRRRKFHASSCISKKDKNSNRLKELSNLFLLTMRRNKK